MRKRLLAVLLSICMVMPVESTAAYAAEPVKATESLSQSEAQASLENVSGGIASAEENFVEPVGSMEEGVTEGGSAEQGTAEQGSAEQGTAEQGSGEQGSTEQGSAEQGSTEQESAEQGTTEQGSPEQSSGEDTSTEEQETTEEWTTEEASVPEETVSDNKVEKAPVSGNKVSVNALELLDMKVEVGAYAAKILIDTEGPYFFDNMYAVLSTDSTVNLNGDGAGIISSTEIVKSKVEALNMTQTGGAVDDKYIYSYSTILEGMEPSTTYTLTVAYKDNKKGYIRKTKVASFTTGEAITESQISFDNVTADTGYYRASLKAGIQNPAKELPVEYGFAYSSSEGGTVDSHVKANFDAATGEMSLQWDPSGVKKTVYPYVLVLMEQGGELKRTYVYGEKYTIELKDITKATLKVEAIPIGTRSVTVGGSISPVYSADSGVLYAHINIKCITGRIPDPKDFAVQIKADGQFSKTDGELMYEGEEYEITVGIGDRIAMGALVAKPIRVTTMKDEVFNIKEIFPDAAFRSYMCKVLNLDENSDTHVRLTKLTNVQSVRITSDAPAPNDQIVKDFSGIEYLLGATSINIQGQDCTTVNVSGLKVLSYLNLNNNDLRELPDMSGLTALRDSGDVSVQNNRIPKEEFTSSNPKLPPLLQNQEWMQVNSSQRGEPAFKIAETYYAQGEKHPFYFEITDTRGRGNYTATVSVDGAPGVEFTQQSSSWGMRGFGGENLAVAEGSHMLSISVKSSVGTESYSIEKTAVFSADQGAAAEVVASKNDTSISFKAHLPALSAADPEKVEVYLKNAGHVRVGRVEYVSFYSSSYGDARYPQGLFEVSFPYTCTTLNVSGDMKFAEMLGAGKYGLEIIADTVTTEIPDVLTITDKNLVSGVKVPYEYNANGEYLYVELSGRGLDPEKIWPVLKEGTRDISEKISAVPSKEGYIYCLKKVNWPAGSTRVDYELRSIPEYDYTSNCKTGSLYFANSPERQVSKVLHNAKTQMAVAFFKESVPEGSHVSAVLKDSSTKTELARAGAVVSEGQAAFLFLVDGVPAKGGKDYIVDVTYPCQEKEYTQSLSYRTGYEVMSSAMLRYVAAGSNSYAIDLTSFSIKKGNLYSAVIKQGNTKIGSVEITAVADKINGLAAGELKGNVTVNPAFAADTDYSVNIMEGTETIYTKIVSGYEKNAEKWFLERQYLTKSGDDLKVDLYTPDTGEAENLTVRIYSLLEEEIKGITIKKRTKDADSVTLTLSGLPDNKVGYYIKAEHKTLGEPFSYKNKDTKYYDEIYGEWGALSLGESAYLSSHSGFKGYTSVSGSAAAFPATVKVCDVGRTEVLLSWKFDKTENFTKTQLNQLPNQDGIYDFIVTSADGTITKYTGTLDVYAVLPDVTGITLDKAKLVMSKGAASQLKAVVTPAGASQSVLWTSSAPEIAAVDGTGKITALAAGKAIIKASAGDKSEECEITVVDVQLDSYDVKLLYDGTKPEKATHQIKVSGNLSPDLTYKSGNPAVASVNATGLVTAAGAGHTVITVAVDGVELEVKVTVTVKIEKLSLDQKRLTLKAGESIDLTARILPLGATLEEDTLWTSSNPEIAAVVRGENPLIGQVTTLLPGTTTITVASGEAKSAECVITVLKEVQKEVPQNLYAVTNVTPSLEDSIFTGENAGWKFIRHEGEIIALNALHHGGRQLFDAVYTEEGAFPFEAKVPVDIVEVQGLTISGNTAALAVGEKAGVTGQLALLGGSLPAESYEIKWEVKNNLVEFDNINAVAPQITAVKAGKATLKATVTLKGDKAAPGKKKVFTASKTIQVTEEPAIDKILLTGVPEGALRDENSVTLPYGQEEKFNKDSEVSLSFEAYRREGKEEGIPLTYKIGDKGIATIASSDGRSVTLKLKGAGITNLTVTAKDEVKYSRTFKISVEDYQPQLDSGTVTLNALKTTGVSLQVYPSNDNEVLAAEMDSNSEFQAAMKDGQLCLTLKKPGEPPKNGSYKQQEVKFTTKNGKVYPLSINIKVEDKAPKATFKLAESANLFYTDSKVIYNVSSSEEIEAITWTPKKDGSAKLTGSFAAGKFLLTPEGLTDCSSKTVQNIKDGIVKITFKDYQEKAAQTMNLKAGVSVKKAAVDLDQKSTTLYPGMTYNYVSLVDKASKRRISLDEGDTITADSLDGLAVTKTADGRILVSYTGKSKASAKLHIQLDGWRQAVDFTHAITTNVVPALQLAGATVTLNQKCTTEEYESVSVQIGVKGNTYAEIEELNTAVGKNAKSAELLSSGGISIIPDAAAKKYVIALNSAQAKKGSYQYILGGSMLALDGAAKMKEAVLTVKISDKAPMVSVRAKGSINPADRNNTEILYTVKLSDMTDGLRDVKLLGAYSGLFIAELYEDDMIAVRASENANLLTNVNYSLQMRLTLDSGYTVLTKAFKIKPKQVVPAIGVVQRNITMHGASYGKAYGKDLDFASKSSKTYGVNIESVQLTSYTDNFSYEDGKLYVKKPSGRTYLKAGKTYQLSFRVVFEGEADNAKATIIKVPVKILK